jgi:hypothetical protein
MGVTAIGIMAVVVVLAIVFLCAFSLVGAFLPELMMTLVAIVAVVGIVAIVLLALSFRNTD